MVARRNKSMPSNRNKNFAEVPQVSLPRSVFKRTSGLKTAFNSGDLIPFFSDEVLPGDSFRLNSQLFGRLSTLLHPYMDNVYIDTQFFFVPMRLVWDNWEKFCGSQDNPGDSTDFTIPQISPYGPDAGFLEGSLPDYLGIPTGIGDISISALYTRAYNLIWNEYFRDQNLQDSVVVDKDNGPDDIADYVILKRGKRHDYFTSCLPFPQKGPSVGLPLTGNAPIMGLAAPAGGSTAALTGYSASFGAFPADTVSVTGNLVGASKSPIGTAASTAFNADNANVFADMSAVSAVTINAFRQAYSLQRFLEKDARGGTRYFELLKAHYGTTSPDSRLQRPEFLGGTSARIDVHTVPQTSETSAESPLGELAGFATISPQQHGFIKSFVEHGIVLGLVSVRSDMTYQQGIERRFSRLTRPDFYWPAFAQLGEQAVLNKEIYAQGTSADDEVFGYQERYAEYRYKPSIVTGVMRSSAAQSLDTWHLAYDFETLPVLSDEFIQENPPIDRVLAVQATEQPQIILDCFHDLKCARVMPMYGIPGLGDRF